MLDFPASPINGQNFVSGSRTWVFDGVKWTTGGAGSTSLLLSTSAFIVPATTVANGATTIDRSAGEFQLVNLSGNATINVVNWPPTGDYARLVLDITNIGSYAITGWPAGTTWPGGTAPTITPGGHDVVILMTETSGGTVLGSVAGQNYR